MATHDSASTRLVETADHLQGVVDQMRSTAAWIRDQKVPSSVDLRGTRERPSREQVNAVNLLFEVAQINKHEDRRRFVADVVGKKEIADFGDLTQATCQMVIEALMETFRPIGFGGEPDDVDELEFESSHAHDPGVEPEDCPVCKAASDLARITGVPVDPSDLFSDEPLEAAS
jgi:hypothetical protein